MDVDVGDKVTARISNKIRGGEVIEVFDDGSVEAEFYTPSRIVEKLPQSRFVLSTNYTSGVLRGDSE